MSCSFSNSFAKSEELEALSLQSGGHETFVVVAQPLGTHEMLWLVSVSLVLSDADLYVFGAQICIERSFTSPFPQSSRELPSWRGVCASPSR